MLVIYIASKFTKKSLNAKEQHEVGCNLRNKLITEYTDLDIENTAFLKTDRGKPYINKSNIVFSISHTEGCVICVMYIKNPVKDSVALYKKDLTNIGEGIYEIPIETKSVIDIGCDVEAIVKKPMKRRLKSIAERYFSIDELEFYKNTGKTPESFYKVWTGKESYLKCTGEGLSGISKADTFNLPEGYDLIELLMKSGELKYSASICVRS